MIRISDKAWLYGGLVCKAGKFKIPVSVPRNLPWLMKIDNSMIPSPSVYPVLFCMYKKILIRKPACQSVQQVSHHLSKRKKNQQSACGGQSSMCRCMSGASSYVKSVKSKTVLECLAASQNRLPNFQVSHLGRQSDFVGSQTICYSKSSRQSTYCGLQTRC